MRPVLAKPSEIARRWPQFPVVAHQGCAGSFGDDAVGRLCPGGATPMGVRSFAAAMDAALCGDADGAAIPTWNSRIGPIVSAHEALAPRARDLAVKCEIELPVRHCLMTVAGGTLADVQFVGSHPAALGQCAEFLKAMPWLSTHAAFDTAGAARELIGWGTPRLADAHDPAWYAELAVKSPTQLAVIASRRAAWTYGLTVLAYDIHDDPANCTRFALYRAVDAAAFDANATEQSAQRSANAADVGVYGAEGQDGTRTLRSLRLL